jgi:hypothetical protein
LSETIAFVYPGIDQSRIRGAFQTVNSPVNRWNFIPKPAPGHDDGVGETALQFAGGGEVVDDDEVTAAERRPAHCHASV